jgi:hypothetical protein
MIRYDNFEGNYLKKRNNIYILAHKDAEIFEQE